MRKTFAVIGLLLVGLLVTLPSVSATTLPGFPYYVYLNLQNSQGNIYIFDGNGFWCGTATLTGVGTSAANTLAWETARDIIVTNPPLNGGTWFTTGAESTPFCTNPTISPLKSFNIDF